MKPIALTPTQQRRLLRLARQAGRTSEHMLKFVLRDGFDYSDWQVSKSRAADAESKRRGTISSEQVQREVRRIIDASRARKPRLTYTFGHTRPGLGTFHGEDSLQRLSAFGQKRKFVESISFHASHGRGLSVR